MTNIDELFQITEHFAAVPCSRPGVLDPCFNACLLLFKPDLKTYQEIMKLWRETTKKDTCPMIRFCLMVFMHTMAGKKFPMLTILGEFSLGLWSHSSMAAATLQSRGWKNVAQVEKQHGICRTSHNCWWCGVSILEELPWSSTEVRVKGLVEIYIVFHANARVSSCFKFFLPDRLTALEKSNYSVGLIL